MKNFVEKPDWSNYEENWLANYDASNYGSSLSARILRSTHNLVEKNAGLDDHYGTVLELGVGTMAHFGCVQHGFERYIASDHDPKVIDWLTKRSWDPRVEIKQLSGARLQFEDDSIDRVIATHVLEHIPDPVSALEEWVRVIRPGGVLSLILPCDPGLAWRIGRTLGPRKRGYAAGLPYDYYMSVEHVNAIYNLHQIIKFHFPERRTKWWPMRAAIPDINLIYGVNCFV